MTTFEELQQRAESDARSNGYYLNPDPTFLKGLIEGLKRNEERYGYSSCPCRLASGKFEFDRDILCPCDYRDPDVEEFGFCYCALYVSEQIALGQGEAEPVPERRGDETKASAGEHEETFVGFTPSGIPVWRCKVCGYLCAREKPPGVCPICKAKRERFERFW